MATTGETLLDQATLVLNKSWTAVNVTTVRRAICLVYLGQAKIIAPETFEVHDFESWIRADGDGTHPVLSTVNFKFRVPEVIVLQRYNSVPSKEVPFSRKNVYRRDNYTCQYCGKRFRAEELTIDHVIPRSRGGRTSWENCVLACVRCNLRKGDRTLEEAGMTLLRKPSKPKWNPNLVVRGGAFPPSWRGFTGRSSLLQGGGNTAPPGKIGG